MYAKVSGTTLIQFPYTAGDLKRDNPNVSFPSNLTLEDAAPYGVVAVTQNPDPAYDPKTQVLEQGVPVESGGSWSVTRTVRAMTQDELDDVARQEDLDAFASDPQAEALLNARPEQINNYIDTNVTDMDSAKEVLKIFGRAIAILSSRIW